MKGVRLTIFTSEMQKHRGKRMYEWLLEFAKEHSLHGGSAFRALTGYGRHGRMHGEHFFELASDVPVEVVFVMSSTEAKSFLLALKNEEISLMYVLSDVEYGSLTST